jgi:hypothetical protein
MGDAHFEQVGKVDEHVRGLGHSTSAVETRSNNVLRPPTLYKVHVDREVEVALSSVRETVGESKCDGESLDPLST